MQNKEKKETLTRIKFDDCFNGAIIGKSFNDLRLVYSFEKLAEIYYNHGFNTDEDVKEAVSVIEQLDASCTEPNSPIIIMDLTDIEKEKLNIK